MCLENSLKIQTFFLIIFSFRVVWLTISENLRDNAKYYLSYIIQFTEFTLFFIYISLQIRGTVLYL